MKITLKELKDMIRSTVKESLVMEGLGDGAMFELEFETDNLRKNGMNVPKLDDLLQALRDNDPDQYVPLARQIYTRHKDVFTAPIRKMLRLIASGYASKV